MKKKLCSIGEKCNAAKAKHFREFRHATELENQLIAVLIRYCGERGDNEGAVETLERIILEREILLKNAIKRDLLKLL